MQPTKPAEGAQAVLVVAAQIAKAAQIAQAARIAESAKGLQALRAQRVHVKHIQAELPLSDVWQLLPILCNADSSQSLLCHCHGADRVCQAWHVSSPKPKIP